MLQNLPYHKIQTLNETYNTQYVKSLFTKINYSEKPVLPGTL